MELKEERNYEIEHIKMKKFLIFGKIISNNKFSWLVLLLFCQCAKPLKNFDIKEKWWYSFDVLRENEGCNQQLGYLELFTWSKNGQIYATSVFDYGSIRDSRDFMVKPLGQKNQYSFSYEDSLFSATFKIINEEEALLLSRNGDYEWTTRYFIIDTFKHKYWIFFGDREKWEKEFLCRQIIHSNKIILGKFRH